MGNESLKRENYYDRFIEGLPKLPEGSELLHEYESEPIAKDIKTGDYYKLINGEWRLADKK